MGRTTTHITPTGVDLGKAGNRAGSVGVCRERVVVLNDPAFELTTVNADAALAHGKGLAQPIGNLAKRIDASVTCKITSAVVKGATILFHLHPLPGNGIADAEHIVGTTMLAWLLRAGRTITRAQKAADLGLPVGRAIPRPRAEVIRCDLIEQRGLLEKWKQ